MKREIIKSLKKAPELIVEKWINTKESINIKNSLGKVIVFEAFQMLCPGCILEGLPKFQKLYNYFSSNKEIVLFGLHTVFEHHNAMKEDALKAFLYEFRYNFPVAIDSHKNDEIPETMKTYNLRGTPSLVLIDKKGYIRKVHFGKIDELELGYEIANLLNE